MDRDGSVQFGVYINEPSVGAQCNKSRATARRHGDRRRLIRRKLTIPGIEALLVNKISAETGVQHVTVRCIGDDAVGLGCGGNVLYQRNDQAVSADSIHGHPAAGIRCAKQVAP